MAWISNRIPAAAFGSRDELFSNQRPVHSSFRLPPSSFSFIMVITQIRNATVLLEFGGHDLLVDPMLSPPSVMPGFRLFRGQRRRNPLTELPAGADELFARATEVILTHEHPDHLDRPAVKWIKSRGLTLWASSVDAPNLQRKGLNAEVLGDGQNSFASEVIPGTHGHGLIGWLMGPVAGFYLTHPDEPSLYITGDTVLTETVKQAVGRLQPDVVIAPAGTANFGLGKDILFSEAELVELVRLAPGQVVFNHLESIDHCPMTRTKLRDMMDAAGIGERVLIPNDGEQLTFERDPHSVPVEPSASPNTKPGFQKWLTAKFAGT